ncbi:hypothetical protein [Streptomyces sp. CC224B]|uniref:hypothetical protein n=1 Tax=Streptomyces sp. CC224B TaxID=3044571 RepID=UPI0024A920E5|nr:hypothetical protein [Streptomyces sp. CC224B]
MLVAVGVVVAVVFVATGNDDSPDKKRPSESSRSSVPRPTPSLSIPTQIPTLLPSGLPTELPSELPTELPSGIPSLPTALPSGLESLLPSPAGDDAP